MIEYYKSIGDIQRIYKIRESKIYKISDNKVYFYDSKTKRWKLSIHSTKQYLFEWHDLIPLTLLDLEMLGVPHD